jgi:asparagine synthase (glutamine-hydrolysing)
MIAILAKVDTPPDAARARRMLAAAPHRGPCLALRTLGHCIVGIATRAELADGGVSGDGPMIAVLSGRVDNAAELHGALAAAGVLPASRQDADIVVAAFRAFGGEAPNRMRGAFAGIVTDGRAVWAFRDHAGFRPLFYHDGPSALVIASEPRQVTVGAGLPETPDLAVLEDMFYGRMPSDMPAALSGVARLPQGSLLTARVATRAVVRRYWHPERLLDSARVSPGEIPERFVHLMEQAAARCVTGNDAVLLSGGVDSPAVAAFAAPAHRQRTGRPLGAVSCVFPDLPRVDEWPHIAQVAERLGLELHTYRPSARALDNVDAWCRVLGGPVPILSVPEVADCHARARAWGYTNLLTGDFAEFVFGTPRHAVAHLVAHGRWRALARLLAAERARGTSWRRLAQEVLLTLAPGRAAAAYIEWRRRAAARIPVWLDPQRVGDGFYRTDLVPGPGERWRRLQLLGTEGSTVTIEAAELCAAIAGVTLRCPFADVDLWEFFLSLPAELKCPDLGHKTLARRLLRGRVPDSVLDRRDKTYFDDHVMAQVDYATLERLLVRPRYRMPGVDYDRLAHRLERRDLNRFEWFWAKDLARIHAFLNAW